MLVLFVTLFALCEAFLLRFLLALWKESLFARLEMNLGIKARREARSRIDKKAERFESAA